MPATDAAITASPAIASNSVTIRVCSPATFPYTVKQAQVVQNAR